MSGAYSPSAEIRALHDVPRWLGSSAFEPRQVSYWMGVGTIPGLAGILGLCVLLNCLCSHCCGRYKPTRFYTMWRVVIVLCVIAIGAGGYLAVRKNETVSDGVKFDKDILLKFAGVFNHTTSQLVLLRSYLGQAIVTLDSVASECPVVATQPQFTNVRSKCIAAQSSVKDAYDDVHEINGYIEDFTDRLDTYENYREIGTLGAIGAVGVVALLLASLVLGAAGDAGCHGCTRPLAVLATLIVGVLWVAIALVAVVAMVGSDYCMDPATNTITQLREVNADAANITSYYLTCTGVTPVQTELEETRRQLNETGESLEGAKKEVSTACPHVAPKMDSLEWIRNNASTSLDRLIDVVSCKQVTPLVNEAIYDGLCDRNVPGIILLSLYLLIMLTICNIILLAVRMGASQPKLEYTSLATPILIPQQGQKGYATV